MHKAPTFSGFGEVMVSILIHNFFFGETDFQTQTHNPVTFGRRHLPSYQDELAYP